MMAMQRPMTAIARAKPIVRRTMEDVFQIEMAIVGLSDLMGGNRGGGGKYD